VKRTVGPDRYAVSPGQRKWTNPSSSVCRRAHRLLAGDGTAAASPRAPFRDAFDFYLDLFRSGLAPALGNNEIANTYQEFARGTFAMWITGPWNLGEFRRRLPAELQGSWGTAPLPGGRTRRVSPGLSLAARA
jgi:multiple sugar transport system substrate-binding protein